MVSPMAMVERNDVVLDLGLELIDALHHIRVNARFFANLCRRRDRHHAAFGQRVRRGEFDCSSQRLNLPSSLQTRPISSRVYRSINRNSFG